MPTARCSRQDGSSGSRLAGLEVFFKGFLLLGIGFRMTWPENAFAVPQAAQVFPPSLRMDLSPRLLLHPDGDFGTGPQPLIGRGGIESLLQLGLLLLGKNRLNTWVLMSAIAKRRRTLRVVTTQEAANATGSVASWVSCLVRRFPSGKQPDHLPMAFGYA